MSTSPHRPTKQQQQVEAEHTQGIALTPDDGSWMARGAAAYQGLNRTDPDALWSFQAMNLVYVPSVTETAPQ